MKSYRLLKAMAPILKRTIALLLVLGLCAAVFPQPAVAVTCVRNHTVTSGDTLSQLAETYKVTLQDLITANNLTEPYTLYIGSTICIPGTAATTTTTTSTTTSSSKGPVMEVSVVGNKIVIETANFPKKNTYYVKAGEKRAVGSQWIRLGRMATRKDGSGDGVFLLPKALRNSRVIDVCMKNVVTDAVVCQRLSFPK